MDEKLTTFVTVEDLAKMFNIGKNAAYELLETEKIKAFRIGRVWKIPYSSVEDYIKSEISDSDKE